MFEDIKILNKNPKSTPKNILGVRIFRMTQVAIPYDDVGFD